ncbi:MAG: CoA transferase [Methanothrix sp.]|nr:CoA transferase [Methanothrix sp.]
MMSQRTKGRILSNVRVLDLGRVIAAPFCARILSDLGAEVIKVESSTGDFVRNHPPFYRGGFSGIFTQYNAGKKAVCIDMRNPKGIELIKKLVGLSDVVVENFRPGVMEELGLAYDVLTQVNKKIILCSISGFGQTGSERDRPAFADVIHAYSGMDYMAMKVQGPGGAPPGFPYSFSDTYAAINAALAILGALFYRQTTGEGQAIDISLLDCILAANDHTLQGFIFSEGALDAPPMAKPPIRMKDGYMAMTPMVSFKGIVKAMGRPELAEDDRFSKDEIRIEKYADESLRLIKDWAATVTVAEASALLERHRVPHAKVNSISEIVNAPVVRERQMLVEVDMDQSLPPALVLNTPAKFSHCPTGPQGRPPYLGEHNKPVLRDILGFSEREIADLHQRGIISHDQKHEAHFREQ